MTCSINQSNNIATYFLDAVGELNGCPVDLVSNLGTGNGIVAAAQAFFRVDQNSHRYVPSPCNQRIESWWSQYSRSSATWLISVLKDLVDERHLDTTSELEMECLWFCFSDVLQRELDEIKEHWNTHFIRKSRHDTISGRPDSLYYLPQLHGAFCKLSLPVPLCELDYVHSHVVETGEENEYQEYFQYLVQTCNLSKPEHLREALQQYYPILSYAFLRLK